MSGKYGALDAAILDVLANYSAPVFDTIYCLVRAEVDVLAAGTERKRYRILDGRLQALRKKGLIYHRNGWRLGPAE